MPGFTFSTAVVSLGRPYDIDFVHTTALDGTIYEGESVKFLCHAKGNPPITYYKLLHNGKEIDKSPSGKYVIDEVKPEHNGTYCCIPINRASIGENRTVALKVIGTFTSCYVKFLKFANSKQNIELAVFRGKVI